ncbi:hypothetical protein [Amycolatopsis sp. NPDC051128]|uniref:hypothetical protein n=1 Tax=Amycolatopsis sp. NPDC051128 TaxID=3155412 RepID=UPI00342E226D
MTEPDLIDWLDPRTNVTADNGYTTTQTPEYDSPPILPDRDEPKAPAKPGEKPKPWWRQLPPRHAKAGRCSQHRPALITKGNALTSTETTTPGGRHHASAAAATLPLITTRGVRRLDDTVPLSRIDAMGNTALDIAADLYRLGAWVLPLVQMDRDQCTHCRQIGHGTVVRFYPAPDPAQRFARTSVPDACGHCAPGVLRELLDEAGGRDVHVEVWHPRAVA